MALDESEILIVTEEEAGERLDKILSKRFSEIHSRTYFQYLISEHLVLLNGEPVKKRMKPQVGDEIEVEFTLTPEINFSPESIPLDIIYEDEELLVINKPAGMVVHPAPGHWSGTFVNALLYHCHQLPSSETLRPGIVHRLDKDTTGLLVAAKTTETQQKLIEQFASRKVYKEYLAICIGNPGEGEINAPIGRHPVHRKKMAIVPNGRKAISFCQTLAWNGKLSAVKVVIATGRTHQIRVHMKHRGTPVLGDELYGNSQNNQTYGVSRQLLHAVILRFEHPKNGKLMEFKAPPSEDMKKHLEKIGWKDSFL
jgi:23S rRNA pseudouridine1911/1915/1917 synthase